METLGRYGRAAYEWRRLRALDQLEEMDDPKTFLSMLDQLVTNNVSSALNEWANLGSDQTIEGVPAEFDETDQNEAARRAIEIKPCLELVFLPVPGSLTAPILGDTSLDEATIDLLTTTSFETRPNLDDLADLGADLEAMLGEERLHPAEIDFNPTAYFPTELAAIQANCRFDLYEIFN